MGRTYTMVTLVTPVSMCVLVLLCMKHINGLAEAMDADMMLIEAERLCRQVLSKPAESLPEDLRAILPTREPTEV